MCVNEYACVCMYICMYICIAYAYCYLLALYRLMHTEYAKKLYIKLSIYYSPLAGICIFTMNLTVLLYLLTAVTRKFPRGGTIKFLLLIIIIFL